MGHSRCSSLNNGLNGCVQPPPLRPDASHPTIPLSITRTSTPSRASHHPAERPVAPPPTMTTEAPVGSVMSLAFGWRVVGRAGGDYVEPRRIPIWNVLRWHTEPGVPMFGHLGRLVRCRSDGQRHG